MTKSTFLCNRKELVTNKISSMKSKILTTALTAMLVFSGSWLMAGPPPPPPPPDTTSAPIDGGALILLIAASFYGYKQLKKQEEKAV